MPIYVYIHPDTEEEFEDLRTFANMDKPFIATDGKKCKRKEICSFNGWKTNKEVFEADSDFVKKCNPKYVKFHDGHREKYDPSKHN
jgi:hypothetical protein